jgi:hypothetical protein
MRFRGLTGARDEFHLAAIGKRRAYCRYFQPLRCI